MEFRELNCKSVLVQLGPCIKAMQLNKWGIQLLHAMCGTPACPIKPSSGLISIVDSFCLHSHERATPDQALSLAGPPQHHVDLFLLHIYERNFNLGPESIVVL